MYLKFTDSDIVCDGFLYVQEENAFHITDSKGETLSYCYPPLKLTNSFDFKNFDLYLFRNDREDNTENSIYRVLVSEKRIGWIFPLQALLSDKHDYADNEFFLNYASVAYQLLLERVSDPEPREFLEEIKLTDFYAQETVVLVVDKENIKEISGFQLEDYLLSLFQYGYSLFGRGNCISEYINIDKNIRLKPTSKEVKTKDYVNNLFIKNLSDEHEPVYVFHTLYQVIELLISDIFEHQFKEVINLLTTNPNALYNAHEMLKDISTEKKRINSLFSLYSKLDTGDCNTLKTKCKSFLEMNSNAVDKEDVASLIYQVRCLIVHNFYLVNEGSLEALKEINSVFLDVDIELLTSYSFAKP